MSSQPLNIDRYVVIHVATTCDEHGVYVTKDSAEVIELGWILVDANSLEEVSLQAPGGLLHVMLGLGPRELAPPDHCQNLETDDTICSRSPTRAFL